MHRAFDLVIDKKYEFAFVFFAVSFGTFVFLYLAGLAPEELQATPVQNAREIDGAALAASQGALTEGRVNAPTPAKPGAELPTRIYIQKIGVNASVSNPSNPAISALDDALKGGAVRYPGSGKPGEGNMLIFGHSTNRAIVNNQAYKTFNNLDKLAIGDEIIVATDARLYVYKVFSVRLTTKDEALVEFKAGRNMLTLSTCNTFGAKQERFVVEADYAGVRGLDGGRAGS